MTATSQKRIDRGEYTIKELAAKLGVNPRTITRISSKPREQYLAERRAKQEEVIELHNEGKKPKEIQQETGYGLSTVYTILKQYA